MKPNNPMIGKTFPIKEMKPINVHINVMIAIIMMSTKYPLENGSVNLEANAYIRPTIVLQITRTIIIDITVPNNGEI